MTLIVYRDGVMCGDSGSWQGEILTMRARKVFKIHGHLVGKMGHASVTSGMIRDFKRTGKLDPLQTKGQEATLIVVTPKREILLYQHGDIEKPRTEFWADGSDARIASWGAMMHGASAREAIEIGFKLGPWVARPILTVRL